MITKYFKCKLLSDVVVNAFLNTEGNIDSLDYIPGSNFLGIFAQKYDDFGVNAYTIFHSGKISFGDAIIAKDNFPSYTIPFSLYTDKLKNNITKDKVWIHHGIDKDNPNIKQIQLKQIRSGYFNKNYDYIKNVKKNFYLKSAYDPIMRRSKDKAMFGFNAIKKGQEFIFSVIFKEEAKKFINEICDGLQGIKYVGKSKTAEYGLVEISEITQKIETYSSKQSQNGYIVIYAESNLCFINEYGQFTFIPDSQKYFGINGRILWNKSQIRTYSYTTWNTKRQTYNTQRNVILKGSVIVVKPNVEVDLHSLPRQVGEFNAEGLGRVIYNPEFLEYNEQGIWNLYKSLNEITEENQDRNNIEISYPLGKFLLQKKEKLENEKEIAQAVLDSLQSNEFSELKDKEITKSQWGAIRTCAQQSVNIDDLYQKLFDEKDGFLMNGVAAEKIWNERGGIRRDSLRKLIEDNKELGINFIIKFTAEIIKIR